VGKKRCKYAIGVTAGQLKCGLIPILIFMFCQGDNPAINADFADSSSPALALAKKQIVNKFTKKLQQTS